MQPQIGSVSMHMYFGMGGLGFAQGSKRQKNKDSFQLVSHAMRGKQRLHETYSLDPQVWMALVR